MTSPLKVPPSIANASRQDLERLLISTLQKLKSRDKKIEELTNAVASSAEQQQAREDDEEHRRVTQLTATVEALQAKLLSSEQGFNDRIAAETELANGQIAQLQRKLDAAATALASERQDTVALQEQLSARETSLEKLQHELDVSRSKEEELLQCQAVLVTERDDLKSVVDSTQEKIATLENALKDAKVESENSASSNGNNREDAKVKELEQEKKTLTLALEERDQEVEKLKAENASLGQSCDALQQQVTALEENVSAATQALEQAATTAAADLNALKQEMESEIAVLRAALEEERQRSKALEEPSTPSPSPIKAQSSEASLDGISIGTTASLTTTFDGASAAAAGASATPSTTIATPAPPAPDADAATLRVECKRLAKELTDTKRKFLAAAKKKRDETAAKIAELEAKLATAAAAAAGGGAADLPQPPPQATTTTPSAPPNDTNSAVSEAVVEQYKQAAEAAKAEVAQIRKEVETERGRFKRAIAESKRRLDVVQREKEVADGAAAEASAVAEALRAELAAMEQKVVAANKSTDAAVEELKDYKTRAHALLKSKEVEIREAKSVALSEQAAALEDAETAATAAEAAAARAQQEVEFMKRTFAENMASAVSTRDAKIATLEQEVATATDRALAANRQYEQVKLRYESLETRTKLLQDQVHVATAAAEAVSTTASQLEAVQQELSALKDSARLAIQSKQAEVIAARETIASLRSEIGSLQTVIDGLKAATAARTASAVFTSHPHSLDQLSTDTFTLQQQRQQLERDVDTDSVMSGTTTNTMTATNTTSNIAAATAAAELARKEKDLNEALRRIVQLQHEIDELERESELRGVQELVLKEAVREAEREVERMKLAGKTVDMEYFKNVMLKLFETGEEESLLPVIGTMLQFSPSELHRCKQALDDRASYRAALASASGQAANVTSYLSSWLPGFSSSTGVTATPSAKPVVAAVATIETEPLPPPTTTGIGMVEGSASSTTSPLK